MSKNILDRVIGYVSPRAGARRAADRWRMSVMDTGYSNYGASRTNNDVAGWDYYGGSHKEDIENNLSILRQRSRDLYMGVPLATGAIKTCRTNVIGSGLRLKARVDRSVLHLSEKRAQKLETQIEKEFAVWAESPDCDLQRLDNFYELQQLCFLNWLLSGDVLVTLPTTKRAKMPYDLRVNLIEADRLSNPQEAFNPRIIGGVEVNDMGEVVAYHISTHHPLSWDCVERKWERVEAYGAKTGRRNVLHIMQRERIGQRRGVPFLSSVLVALKQLGRYINAELVAAVVNGLFTVFIEKDGLDDGSEEGAFKGLPDNGLIPNTYPKDSVRLGNGIVADLAPGEHAKEVKPGRPNANFDGFVVAMCRQIGAALEIPYEMIVKQFSSNYSASRGAILEAWKMFKMYRNWIANDFCQPIYEEWFAEAVAKGRILAPGFFDDPIIRKAYCGAEWNGPSQGQLDPVKEVQAAELRVQNRFSTRQRETVELTGGDFVANVEQSKREEQLMKEARGDGEPGSGGPAEQRPAQQIQQPAEGEAG